MLKLYNVVDMICGAIDWIVRVILVLLLLLIILLVTGQVILRFIGGLPFFWVGELSGYAFAYIAFLGASVCLRSDEHIRVPLLLDKVPLALRRMLVIGIYLIAIIYGYHVGWFGYRFAMMGAYELSPTSSFILFWPRLALVIGGFLLALQAFCLILREIAGAEHKPPRLAFGKEDEI